METSILFNNAPCGYHTVDESGVFTSINDTLLRWLGYDREEVLGKMRFRDIIHGDLEKVVENLARVESANAAEVELVLIRKSGERFPVVLSVVNVRAPGTNLANLLFSTIDNTKCQEALERIKHLDQELEDFSYSISHDLRAPLRSIDGYSKILQEDYAGRLDDEGRRVLGVVMNNARRMGKLIDDILDFNRLGRKPLQRSPMNMTSLVNNIVQELVSAEPGRKINVEIGNLLPSFADADMIRQVWFNLIENAVKYTGKKEIAAISVSSYHSGDAEVCYEVKDNGVGFDMQYAGKLFGVFQRLHKMQDFSGTGVGLAIVKRIITRHGGQVWAEAELNTGATFYFTLPIE